MNARHALLLLGGLTLASSSTAHATCTAPKELCDVLSAGSLEDAQATFSRALEMPMSAATLDDDLASFAGKASTYGEKQARALMPSLWASGKWKRLAHLGIPEERHVSGVDTGWSAELREESSMWFESFRPDVEKFIVKLFTDVESATRACIQKSDASVASAYPGLSRGGLFHAHLYWTQGEVFFLFHTMEYAIELDDKGYALRQADSQLTTSNDFKVVNAIAGRDQFARTSGTTVWQQLVRTSLGAPFRAGNAGGCHNAVYSLATDTLQFYAMPNPASQQFTVEPALELVFKPLGGDVNYFPNDPRSPSGTPARLRPFVKWSYVEPGRRRAQTGLYASWKPPWP